MFADRRRRFMEAMEGGAALLFAAPERVRSNDTHYRFRQDSYLHYLTGFPEPESVAVLLPGHPEHEFVLFVRPRNRERETWEGRRFGPEGAAESFGADAAHPIEKLPELLPGFLEHVERLHFAVGRDPAADAAVMRALDQNRAKIRLGIRPPEAILDPRRILDEMRVIKSPEEIAIMRRAADVSAEGHRAAMEQLCPGMPEFEVEALIEYAFRRGGAVAPAYGTIAGGGVNATILHYTENTDVCRDGDLLLVDAGAEVDGYAGDITRTFPVNGTFTEAQRKAYTIVLESQVAAIAAAQPGNRFDDVHEAALRVLTEGLVRLGVLSGDVEDLLRDEAYKPYYMHRTSHWLGIDVHDVGAYRDGDASRPLQPGMVLTIEPGLYFAPDLEEVPEAYRGLGIRIEDDVLITEQGHDVLTAAAPKTVEEIEATMRRTSAPVTG